MTWWQKLLGLRPKLPIDIFFKIRSLRLQNIQENYSKFCDLLKKAVEKQGGEYVIDRQYLNSLLDDAFGLAREIACDMSVIADRTHYPMHFKLDYMKADLCRILNWQPQTQSDELVIPCNEIDELEHYHHTGGIFTRLAEIQKRLGVHAPEGFVISFAAFHLFMEKNGLFTYLNRISASPAPHLLADLQEKIQQAFIPLSVREEVEEALDHMMEIWGSSTKYILRATIFGEEYNKVYQQRCQAIVSAEAVNSTQVLEKYKNVVAELYTEQQICERIRHNMDIKCYIAVSVSRFLDSQCQGKIYTIDPESSHYANMRIEVRCREKEQKYQLSRCVPHRFISGNCDLLSPQKIEDLAEKAMRIERYYKFPQEMAWCMEQSIVYIVHSRPLELNRKPCIPPKDLATVTEHQILYDQAGQVACSGIYGGRVQVVSDVRELNEFPDQGIMVIESIKPELYLLRVLPRVGAILTEQGEVTSHAASLVREFHVPTIMGLENITQRLQSGDMLTVDAYENIIYRDVIDELLNYHLWEHLDLDNEKEYELLRFLLHRLSSSSAMSSKSRRSKFQDWETLDKVVRMFVNHAYQSNAVEIQAMKTRVSRSLPMLDSNIGMRLYIIDINEITAVSLHHERKQVNADDIDSSLFRAFWKGFTIQNEKRLKAKNFGFIISSAEHFCFNLSIESHIYILDGYCCNNSKYNYIYGYFADLSSKADNSRRLLWLRGVFRRFHWKVKRDSGGLSIYRFAIDTEELTSTFVLLGEVISYIERQDGLSSTEPVEKQIEDFIGKGVIDDE